MRENSVARQVSLVAWGVVIISALLGAWAVGYFFESGPIIWVSMALALPTMVLHIGAGSLFLAGLKDFSPKFKRGYWTLCIGFMLLGLAHAQLPVYGLLNWWVPLQNGALTLPYIVAYICIFMGVRAFARLLGVRGFWTSFWWVMILGVVLAAASTFLPHVPNPAPEYEVDASLAFTTWTIVLIAFVCALAWRIRWRIGAAYANAMAWLFVASACLLAAGVIFLLSELLTAKGDWIWDDSLAIAPFMLAGVVIIRAGYAFYLAAHAIPIKNTAGAFFGAAEAPKLLDSSPVDLLIFVAGLATRPEKIDSRLDDVRLVTTRMQQRGGLSANDIKILAGVYRDLEHFLAEQEPVRPYSKTELRHLLQGKFALDAPALSPFWLVATKEI